MKREMRIGLKVLFLVMVLYDCEDMRGQDRSRGSGSGEAVLPQSGSIVFRHDFYDGSSVAQVGGGTYTRSGSLKLPRTSTLVADFGANQIPIGSRLNQDSTLKGAWFGGRIDNHVLYSEDFTNGAWVSVGTGAASGNTSTAPDGTLTADTISGSSTGDGLTQEVATAAAASCVYIFSIYLKTSSGSATPTIIIKDAGTEGNYKPISINTTWDRYEIPVEFSATATGNVSVQIIVGNSSNVRAWGAQLEKWTSGNASRARYGAANPYVPTTSALATSGNAFYSIPNSIVTQIATKGTFAAWVQPEWDFSDNGLGNIPYLFSVNGEQLAFSVSRTDGGILWINGAQACLAAASADYNAVYGLVPNQWTHLVITWDTDADIYKIYFNGVESGSSTTARSPAVVGSNVMNLGGYESAGAGAKDLGADALMSETVFWKIPLTATEVANLFTYRFNTANILSVPSGKVFEVNFENSPIPTTGDTQYTIGVRRGKTPVYYADSLTTLKPTSSTQHSLPAYVLNSSVSKAGMEFHGPQTNHILQSEAITTTWTAVGAPTLTAGAGTFLGTITYGTILTGGTNQGIQQSLATAAASTGWVASVYVQGVSGTTVVDVTLEGDSGGTPETTTSSYFVVTAEVRRLSVYKNFSGSATGNVRMKVTCQSSGVTVRVGGMQLEKTAGTGFNSYWTKPAAYMKTTTTSVTAGWNQIIYRGLNSFNPQSGTAIAWAYLWYNGSTEGLPSDGPTLIGAPGQYVNFYWTVATGFYNLWYGGEQPIVQKSSFSVTAGQWVQYGVTWDHANGTYKLFIDGAEVATATNLNGKAMLPRKLIIGGDYVFGNMDFWHGAIREMIIYGDPNSTYISNDWSAKSTSYGR